LKLPAQVAKLGVVLEVDRLVRNCGLDAIFLCKQKNKNDLYKAGNPTNQNISSFGEYVPQSYHVNIIPIKIMETKNNTGDTETDQCGTFASP